MYCLSMSSSGSAKGRPASLLRQPTVFLKFEISCDLAASPRYRLLGPKPTRELRAGGRVSRSNEAEGATRGGTYGVARLETSFVICPMSARCQPACRVRWDERVGG